MTTLALSTEAPFDSGLWGETADLAKLDGRLLLIVMGSYPGKRPIYERAREHGLRLVVLDGPGHWAQSQVHSGLFEQFIEVDLRHDETLFDRALQAVEASGLSFDGIATFEEFAGPLAAQLAEALGLPGHAPGAVAAARDKASMRRTCMRAGIPTPRFATVRSLADLERAAEHVGFPAILKPVSGASSVSSFKVSGPEKLRARYADVTAGLGRCLKKTTINSDDELDLVWASGTEMILEEILVGEEFDIDCLLSGGEMVYAGITRDWPQPFCKEVGAEMPPLFPAERQREMEILAGRVLKALGFIDGVFHVEMMYTSAGPRIIEVNARMGGGPRRDMNRLVWGIDLADEYLMSAMGMRISPRQAARPLTHLAHSFLPSPATGLVQHTRFLDPIANDPRVIECRTVVQPGQRVVGQEAGAADWLGSLIVSGDTPAGAVAALEELVSRIEFPILPEKRS